MCMYIYVSIFYTNTYIINIHPYVLAFLCITVPCYQPWKWNFTHVDNQQIILFNQIFKPNINYLVAGLSTMLTS